MRSNSSRADTHTPSDQSSVESEKSGNADSPITEFGDDQDFVNHRNYIHQNPVERGLVNDPAEYRYCSAFPGFKLDPWTPAAKAEISKSA